MVGALCAQLYSGRSELRFNQRCFNLYRRSNFCLWGSFFLGIGLTSFVVFFYKDSLDDKGWGIAASMLWNGLTRALFVTGMMLVLIATFEGRLTWVKAFLAWGPFQVIGKLTYSAYLIHICVILGFTYSRESSFYNSRDAIFFIYFGIYLLAYFVAALLTLLVEIPFINIERILLCPKRSRDL